MRSAAVPVAGSRRSSAARVWRLVLSRGCGVGAAWASLEAFGAYCLLRKADQNKKRFANQLKDC